MSKVNLGAGGSPTRTIRRSDPEKRKSVRRRAAEAALTPLERAARRVGRGLRPRLQPKAQPAPMFEPMSDAFKILMEDPTEGGAGLSEAEAKRALKRMRGGGMVKKTGVRKMRGGGMAKKRKK